MTFKLNAIAVFLLAAANVFVFLYSVLQENKLGLCKEDYPNSLGGLAIKALKVVFDALVFLNYCLGWGLSSAPPSPTVLFCQ